MPSCGIMLVKLVLRCLGLTRTAVTADAARIMRNNAKSIGPLERIDLKLFICQLPVLKT